MKSFVVCAFLLAIVATSAQAGAVKTRDTEVSYSCDLKGIMTLTKDMVANSIAVVFDVKADLSSISSGVLSCVKNDMTKPEALVDCVMNNVETEGRAAYTTVKQYLSDMRSSIEQLKSKLHQCMKI